MKISTPLVLFTFLLPKDAVAYRPSVHPSDTAVSSKAVADIMRSKAAAASDVTEKSSRSNNKSNSDASSNSSSSNKVQLKESLSLRKKWGVDNDHDNEYWFDDRIHTLGNNGFWGAVHAALAPISTKIIDDVAYEGIDIRRKLSQELFQTVGKQKARVVDLCCGVGFSTRALHAAFPDAETVVGIDTSPEMVAMAEFITEHIAAIKPSFSFEANRVVANSYAEMKLRGSAMKKRVKCFRGIKFELRNAEDTQLPNKSYDLVTIMYAFHEAPHKGRERILKEARRLLSPGGTLAVVDISAEYVPTESMLRGEPYVQEYQKNIHRQLAAFQGFERPKYQDIVPRHLGMWTLKRSAMA